MGVDAHGGVRHEGAETLTAEAGDAGVEGGAQDLAGRSLQAGQRLGQGPGPMESRPACQSSGAR